MHGRSTRVVAAILVALTAACTRITDDAGSAPSPAGSTATATPPRSTSTAIVYFLLSSGGRTYLARERHEVVETTIGRGPLERMVDGAARDTDLSSPWPTDARILNLTVADGIATVDWSAEVLEANVTETEERLGIQQAVWTLTEIAGIERVAFRVEGKSEGPASNGRRIEDWWGNVGLTEQPFSRGDDSLLEPITIWDPEEGESVGTRFIAHGDASVFEATVGLRLRDARNRIVHSTFATASEGAPGRGTWRTTLLIPSGHDGELWTLEAFESGGEDGRDGFVQTRLIAIGG